jgi:hypothetical protein
MSAYLTQGSFAKYAAAFRKKSRSIFTWASSRFTLANSISASDKVFFALPTKESLPFFASLTQ